MADQISSLPIRIQPSRSLANAARDQRRQSTYCG
uniref:Uncharacterized protein n=1 Tax=Arundo donax TaxID=35708 RepID=A0A0A9C104_ARUDO